MRYYLIAGERSGDLHAGNLVKALKQHDLHAQFRGFGGDYMQEAGVELAVHYKEIAFMGFAEVIRNLGTISRYLKKCKNDIRQYSPDVVILIDYAGFNMKIAKFCKSQGIKVFYYISPKVWAWNQKRAFKLKAWIDKMFVILPFEKDFYKKFNWSVDYVGNPVLDAIKAHSPNNNFLADHQLTSEKPVIALLPGSRMQELQNIVPIMAEVVKDCPRYQFAIATVSNLNPELYKDLKDLPNVRFIYDQTYDLLGNATAAIVTSGTATLETALLNVPQIVVYKTSTVSYRIAKFFIRVPFISLVNLILGRELVKELIQDEANPQRILKELESLLSEKGRSEILSGYSEIMNVLDTGSASDNAGKLIVNYLTGK